MALQSKWFVSLAKETDTKYFKFKVLLELYIYTYIRNGAVHLYIPIKIGFKIKKKKSNTILIHKTVFFFFLDLIIKNVVSRKAEQTAGDCHTFTNLISYLFH